jgi:hypothetical protein
VRIEAWRPKLIGAAQLRAAAVFENAVLKNPGAARKKVTIASEDQMGLSSGNDDRPFRPTQAQGPLGCDGSISGEGSPDASERCGTPLAHNQTQIFSTTHQSAGRLRDHGDTAGAGDTATLATARDSLCRAIRHAMPRNGGKPSLPPPARLG